MASEPNPTHCLRFHEQHWLTIGRKHRNKPLNMRVVCTLCSHAGDWERVQGVMCFPKTGYKISLCLSVSPIPWRVHGVKIGIINSLIVPVADTHVLPYEAPALLVRLQSDQLCVKSVHDAIESPVSVMDCMFGVPLRLIVSLVDDMLECGGPRQQANMQNVSRLKSDKKEAADIKRAPEPLNETQRVLVKSVTAKILWLARQGRPDVVGAAAFLSQIATEELTMEHLKEVSRVVQHLRQTKDLSYTIHPIDRMEMKLVVFADGSPGS
eukprot:3066873-Amphidinium_carterae.1